MIRVFAMAWRRLPFQLRSQKNVIWTVRKFISILNIASKILVPVFQFIKSPKKTLVIRKNKKNVLIQLNQKIAYKKFIISWPTYDFELPLKQRPQHIAENIAKRTKYAYMFCSRNFYDNTKGLVEINDNLFISTKFWKYAKKSSYIHIYATDPTLSLRTFKKIERLGKPIIYEILDEFDTALQGGRVNKALTRHDYALRSNQVELIITTAESMVNGIPENFREKVRYIPNACDPNHFQIQHIPEGKPVIGYFGALASWFDYEIIRYCAQQNPEWTFLLLGIDYDGSLGKSRVLELANVEYLGVVDYKELPGKIPFTVSILPFILNEITLSTSPVKVYEYLACGFPVVATPIPECLKISEIAIGKSKEEFELQIKNEITCDNEDKRKLRRDFSLTQTWESRALAYFSVQNEIGFK